MDKATAPLKGFENNLKKVDKAATGMNKKFLGLGLGLTFFMFGVKMQLDRMLRSMFNVFKQAEGETGVLLQQFNIMKASLAGISIAFFDAFAQSALFNFIINAVSSIANWFLDLTDKQREWLSTSLFIFSGFIFGLSLIGQALLALFVISHFNPIITAVSAAVFAIGILAAFFKTSVDDIKADWDTLIQDFNRTDITGFDKVKLVFTDFLIWASTVLVPTATTLLGAFYGALLGGPVGAAIGAAAGAVTGVLVTGPLKAGLEQQRADLLSKIGAGESIITGLDEAGIGTTLGGGGNMGLIAASLEEIGQIPDKLIDKLVDNPMPILDNEGLKVKPFGEGFDVFSKTDEKELAGIEKHRLDILAEAKKQVDELKLLVTAVGEIELNPQITIKIAEDGSSTTE